MICGHISHTHHRSIAPGAQFQFNFQLSWHSAARKIAQSSQYPRPSTATSFSARDSVNRDQFFRTRFLRPFPVRRWPSSPLNYVPY